MLTLLEPKHNDKGQPIPRNVGFFRMIYYPEMVGKQIFDLFDGEKCDFVVHDKSEILNNKKLVIHILNQMHVDETLTIISLNHIANSVENLIEILSLAEMINVRLRVIDVSLRTDITEEKSLLFYINLFNTFQKEINRKKQSIGIAKAKKEGKYRGRKPILPDIVSSIIDENKHGILSKAELAVKYKLGVSTVYRICKK